MYLQLEAAAGSPWFLGDTFSAIDLYLAALTRWRPGRAWFLANTPGLAAIAGRAAALGPVAPVVQRHFG
jgi:GST-like protein